MECQRSSWSGAACTRPPSRALFSTRTLHKSPTPYTFTHTRIPHALSPTPTLHPKHTWTYPQLPAQRVAPQTQVTSPWPAFGATNTNDTGIPAASQTTLARVRHPEGSDGVPGDRLGRRARCTLETARLVWRDLVSVFDWMGGGWGLSLVRAPAPYTRRLMHDRGICASRSHHAHA